MTGSLLPELAVYSGHIVHRPSWYRQCLQAASAVWPRLNNAPTVCQLVWRGPFDRGFPKEVYRGSEGGVR